MDYARLHKHKDIRKIFSLISIAFIVGVLGGFGAVIFRKLIACIYNLSFSGHLSTTYKETMHAPVSVWGVGIILVPVIGSFLVTAIIENFAADQKGLSVSAIIYAICRNKGKINPFTALAKIIAAAISIGTGGSIGREGPITQISAVISSVLGDVIRLSTQEKDVLIAAGVAAATATVFNAPLAGLAFALELFLISANIFNIILIIISIITATVIGYYFFGTAAIFSIATLPYAGNFFKDIILLCYMVPFGILTGLISLLFIHGIYWTEDFFVAHIKNSYLRHALGMALVGIMMYLMMHFSGHYYIEGIGFATIQDTLDLTIKSFWLLVILFISKFLATCLTLGSGASGGVFSPSLFLGATLGAAVGSALHYFFPSIVNNPLLFVITGMAGMLGSVTGVVMTAIILILEITREYHAILSVIVMTLVAYLTRRLFSHESVYTLALVRHKKNW